MKHEIITLENVQIIGMAKEIAFCKGHFSPHGIMVYCPHHYCCRYRHVRSHTRGTFHKTERSAKVQVNLSFCSRSSVHSSHFCTVYPKCLAVSAIMRYFAASYNYKF